MGVGERLKSHRAVVAWLEYQLAQERRKVQDLEAEVAAREQAREDARRARYTVETTWPDMPNVLHRSGCRYNSSPQTNIRASEAVQRVRDDPLVCCTACDAGANITALLSADGGRDDGT
ncbi:hypothetical protein DY218_27365 [Streptomyces triticagri]|uniref:Uncharacterized protein n=2 Tax=Streptomyces triticagri TaxID=2293568 RepID=A0A372LYJ2_9ACTN|nr:hypothetical protein DY218_27365 [Streptomyces triticagri]